MAVTEGKEDTKKKHKTSTVVLLCMVSFLMGADNQILPSCFRALEADIGLSPTRLSTAALVQGISCSLASPVFGNMLDKGSSCKRMLCAGCAGWGIWTLMLAIVSDFQTILVLRLLNGIALSVLGPVVQVMLAELTVQEERGMLFGICGFCQNAGCLFAAVVATGLSNVSFWNGTIKGWRIAFGAVAIASMLLSLVLSIQLLDHRQSRSESQSLGDSFLGLMRVCRSSTFLVLMLQGTFGCIPWSALSFSTTLCQYEGMPDALAGTVVSTALICGAFGVILGGFVSDRLHQYSPLHGRTIAAQISTFSGIPLAVIAFCVVPRRASSAPIYSVIFGAAGLLCTWCDTGINRPILLDVVPVSHRARVLACLNAVSGSVGALGTPLVALVAERVFGYQTQSRQISEIPQAELDINLNAIANGLALMTVCPWALCFLSYALLHETYPRDLERLKQEREASRPSHEA